MPAAPDIFVRCGSLFWKSQKVDYHVYVLIFFKRWCKLNYFVFSPQIKSRLTFCIFKSVRIIPNVSHNKGTKTFKGLSKEIKNVLNTVLPHLHIAIITSFSLENIEGQKVNKIS